MLLLSNPHQLQNVHTILRVNGKVNNRNVSFLIDSGAAVSAVHTTLVPDSCVQDRPMSQGETVGANGTPLGVVGQATLLVTLGNFQVQQQFIVVKDLSVDCLLGADFLVTHKVIIDCGVGKLHLGGTDGQSIPFMPREGTSFPHGTVSALHTVEIPGRSILLIQGRVNSTITRAEEGLVEPLDRPEKPNRVLLARSLATPGPSNEVTLQVANVGPCPIKLFKGTTLGTFIPRDRVMIVADSKAPNSTTKHEFTLPPKVNIDSSLTSEQQSHLRKLLEDFADLFDQNQLG